MAEGEWYDDGGFEALESCQMNCPDLAFCRHVKHIFSPNWDGLTNSREADVEARSTEIYLWELCTIQCNELTSKIWKADRVGLLKYHNRTRSALCLI